MATHATVLFRPGARYNPPMLCRLCSLNVFSCICGYTSIVAIPARAVATALTVALTSALTIAVAVVVEVGVLVGVGSSICGISLAHAQSPAPANQARGLPALGGGGGLNAVAKPVDSKTIAFETEILDIFNKLRQKEGADPLRMDEKLRLFARREAELAATGNPQAAGVDDRIRQQTIAPYGHYLQFGFGIQGKAAANDLAKDPAVRGHLVGAFMRAGIGAFYVPDTKPYYQFAVLLVRDTDPMAGKPGLSPSDTDPVMQAATPKFKPCYDSSLKDDPNLRGDCVVQIVIGATGAVDSAKMLRSLPSDTFNDCVVGIAKTLKFPTPYKGKPVTLNHPMRFTPPQGDKRVGRLTPGQVTGAFSKAQLDFKACYDARVKENPKLTGTITLGLTVAADGTIDALDVVHNELADEQLTTCVLKRARQVRFPIPEFNSPVDLTYPLRFEAPPPPPKP